MYESDLCVQELGLLSQIDNVKVIFAEKKIPFNGYCDSHKSTIKIRGSLDLKQSITTLLFELCNEKLTFYWALSKLRETI